jgi:hypothetical protein
MELPSDPTIPLGTETKTYCLTKIFIASIFRVAKGRNSLNIPPENGYTKYSMYEGERRSAVGRKEVLVLLQHRRAGKHCAK